MKKILCILSIILITVVTAPLSAAANYLYPGADSGLYLTQIDSINLMVNLDTMRYLGARKGYNAISTVELQFWRPYSSGDSTIGYYIRPWIATHADTGSVGDWGVASPCTTKDTTVTIQGMPIGVKLVAPIGYAVIDSATMVRLGNGLSWAESFSVPASARRMILTIAYLGPVKQPNAVRVRVRPSWKK